ncbi:hypothetical protein CLOP_g12331 [Closterium sp. NIES-67]|nr:hypothetical protein CLOP_g12331 [Closterium sp. NIES-67]
MDHALAGPQRGKWLVSRDAEYNSQMENHTWDLVYLPNGKKAIQCKWLAKIKTDEKGEPSVYKSRLVAKGFQQKEKEDYKEVFAPTANSPTLRVLLAVAAVRKWKVKQMDIVTAFLYGIVEEELKEKELRVKTRGNSNPWSGAYSTLLCILGLTSALLWDSWLE